MKRSVILVILDGWGVGEPDQSNPIHEVNPQNINYLKANFPAGLLQASGISVGLPWGEEGNSEVGHLNLGAGKIIYQNFPRITLAIRDGSFFKNQALQAAYEHAKKYNSNVNLIGLLSEGNVHASFEHLMALIQFAQQKEIPQLNLHLFTDGRDGPPDSALKLISRLRQDKFIKLASLSGRFYAMDRERHWDRTQKVYSVLVGEGPSTDNIEKYIEAVYDRKFSDEFIEPISVKNGSGQKGLIKNNDTLIFFNFREDRIRQLASAFIDKNFQNFPVKSFTNLYIATMTQYDKSFNVPVVFQPEKVEVCLSKVLQDNGKFQLKVAETQKYPHITYFFNGMREEPFKNEYRILIPSKTIVRQEEQPEMMAQEISTRAIESIQENAFDFILINYANADMIAHTGDYSACLKAVKIIDEQIGKLTETVLEHKAVLIITSDHGNIERVLDPLTGMPETKHNPNPVPIHLVAKEFKFKQPKVDAGIYRLEKETIGILADVAPTILELMGIPKPKEMTGRSLLRFMEVR